MMWARAKRAALIKAAFFQSHRLRSPANTNVHGAVVQSKDQFSKNATRGTRVVAAAVSLKLGFTTKRKK